MKSLIYITIFNFIIIINLNIIYTQETNQLTQEQKDIYEKNINLIFNTSYEYLDNTYDEIIQSKMEHNYHDIPEDDMKIFKQIIKNKYIDNNFKTYEAKVMNATTNRNIHIQNQLQIPTHRQPKKRETACGVRNGGGLLQSRLHNGTESNIFEYPWVVAIFEKTLNIDRPKFICSGSIIHPKVILSTAAKFNSYVENNRLIKTAVNKLFARAGEHDLKSSGELIADQERDIQRIIFHRNYKRFYSGYDISIVIVERQFDIFKINVKPICLPSPEMNFDNELCYTVGWGKDNWGKLGKYQTKLQFIDLPILNDNDCIEKIKNESNNEIVIKQLPSATLCAGGQSDHKDACKGDSGSPLFCPIKNSILNQYYQVGIVSSGFDCSKSYPGFYTNIPAVRTFIDSIMDQLDLEKDTYKFRLDSIIDDDDDDDDNDMDVDAYNNDDIINVPAVIETADQNMRAVPL